MFNLIRLSSQPLYYVSVKVVPVVDIVRYAYYICFLIILQLIGADVLNGHLIFLTN